jgi:hypothetical protein
MVIHARPSSTSYVTSVNSSIALSSFSSGSGHSELSAFLYGLTINILYGRQDLNRAMPPRVPLTVSMGEVSRGQAAQAGIAGTGA